MNDSERIDELELLDWRLEWRQLADSITAFEEWQQESDDDGYTAIHVALLLSRECRIIPPETT